MERDGVGDVGADEEPGGDEEGAVRVEGGATRENKGE